MEKLQHQKTRQLFTYSIVVVDNDLNQSAKGVVDSFTRRAKIEVYYYVEPEQNIALARNKGVENAMGDFVAFIDDDEFPNDDWLLNLYRALNKYGADSVLGPVKPYFETAPPAWILKGKFFERPSHQTGTWLNWQNTRTGNALLKRYIFGGPGSKFNPAFGSGGEDRDFFRRMIEKGYLVIWCAEAPVYETVSPQRYKRVFMVKRALLRGKVSTISCTTFDIVKSIFAVMLYTIALPMLFVLGHHYFMGFLIKDFDHLGRIMAYFGVDIIKERYLIE